MENKPKSPGNQGDSNPAPKVEPVADNLGELVETVSYDGPELTPAQVHAATDEDDADE